MQLKFTVRNYNKIAEFIRSIPQGTKRLAAKAAAEYFLGDSSHGLRHDDPYQQTTRTAVYGRQWESEKQRKYVMAKIRSGEIVLGQRKYIPTKASGGYKLEVTRDGYTITNKEPGAFWTRIWNKWPRWRSENQVIKSNLAGALRAATAAVNRYLKSRGK